VILVATVVLLGVSVLVQRHMSDPDFGRTVSMRWAKGMERFHAKLAAWSWKAAEGYRKSYDRGQPP
jgi:hypothetical protein